MDQRIQQALMAEARAEAERSWREGGIPVGAVLAREDGTVVARGHNQRVQSGDPTSHGETQCIRNAGRRRDWSELTLVTTLSPCPMCAGTAVLLGFRRVLIGERRSYRGAEHWLQEAGISVDCLDDAESLALMQRLQAEKPELWREDIGLPPAAMTATQAMPTPTLTPTPTPTPKMPPALDFDGDYGRTYRSTIRNAVPGYDSLMEISAAALTQAAPQATSLLVVGPGAGEELAPILAALPAARVTLLEPSQQMAEACRAAIAAAGADGRCELLPEGLAPGRPPAGAPFDAVVCLNVLHLLPPTEQEALLASLAGCVAAGGCLVLGAHSEPRDGASLGLLLEVAASRLRQRGLDPALIERLLASRDTLVFSLDQDRLQACLTAAGLTPPLLLQQALLSRLWLSRRLA
ncbi:MAG: deaminase [Cyanobium sp.]